MLTFIFFVLASLGLTHIVVDSKIIRPVREFIKPRFSFLYKLISCHQCFGFWGSILVGYLVFGNYSIAALFLYGLMGSYLGLFSDTFLSFLETRTGQEIPSEENSEV